MRLPTAAATVAALLLGAVPADASYLRVTESGASNGVQGGRVGTLYHFGVSEVVATGDDPVTLVGVAFGEVDGPVRSVDGYVTSRTGPGARLGGDQGPIERTFPGAVFVPVRGATVRPGDDGWWLIVSVVADRFGTVTTDDVLLTYRTSWGRYVTARIDYDLTLDVTS